MAIGLFFFKFFFCIICWSAVTAVLGWLYSSLCTKLKRDETYSHAAFMLCAIIGTLIGAIMAGLSAEDSFLSVSLVAAPAVLVGCAVGAVIGLFFKQKPWPRRHNDT